MFCQKCGTAMADTAAACPSCNASVATATPAAPTAGAADMVKGTLKEALAAFKTLAGNPVGGLQPAYAALGEAKVLRTGVTFGIVSFVCFLLGGYLSLPSYDRGDVFEILEFGGVMKGLIFCLTPFLCTTAGSAAVRSALGGQGTLRSDCFISGAALLPASFCMVLSGIVGLENYEWVLVFATFAGCIGVMMLFAAYTRISKLTERAGAAAVPIVVVLSAWLASVMAKWVMTSV